MNDNSILKLLDGMNTQQAKEFTRRILPALEVVRAEVLGTAQASQKQAEVIHDRYNMHGENRQRQTMRRQTIDG